MVKTRPIVSIVILMHNIKPFLLRFSKECFDSIKQYTVYPAYEIVVVDNASTEPGAEELRKEFVKNGAIVVHNTDNLGFTGGFNSGIKICSGDYIFLVENDVIVTPFWVTNALKVFTDNPKCGIVKACENDKLRNADKREEDYDPVERMKEIQDSWKPHFDKYKNDTIKSLEAPGYGIDSWTSLWCCALRKSMIDDLGEDVFDEKIGLNWDEDMDLIWKARDKGWFTAICNQMYVFHRPSSTTQFCGVYAASKEKEVGRQYFRKKHDLVYSEHGWGTRRKNRTEGEAQGHTYYEYDENKQRQLEGKI